MAEIFDRHGVRPSVLINSDAAIHYPQIIEEGKRRNWAWLAHGKNNSILHNGILEADEPAILADVVETIERATGTRPKGWMGPALTETFNTPRLLRDLGLSYVLDWTADDQPFRLNVPGMLSVPYTLELNDINLFVFHGLTGPQFADMLVDQFDQLYHDGKTSGRVMSLALHPFVIGQAFRARHLDKALQYIVEHDGVWVTTTDEIAAHYEAQSGRASTPSPAL